MILKTKHFAYINDMFYFLIKCAHIQTGHGVKMTRSSTNCAIITREPIELFKLLSSEC